MAGGQVWKTWSSQQSLYCGRPWVPERAVQWPGLQSIRALKTGDRICCPLSPLFCLLVRCLRVLPGLDGGACISVSKSRHLRTNQKPKTFFSYLHSFTMYYICRFKVKQAKISEAKWEFAVSQGYSDRGSVTTWRGGKGWEVGGRGTYVLYLWVTYVDVWQKPISQSSYLSIKNKKD